MDQSAAAQSQPDLLGLPYTAHENVLMRRRNLDHSLSVSPAQLNSRLSMPAFVFSCTSLRGSENSPSTSSSFTNDMALRAGGIEGENTADNSETDDSSVNEQVNRNMDNDLEATCSTMQNNAESACDSPSGSIFQINAQAQSSTEVNDSQNSTSVPNCEDEESNLNTECVPSTSTNLDTTVNEVNIDDTTNETRQVNDNIESLDTGAEDNSHTSETVLLQDEEITSEGNNENVSYRNEVDNVSAEATTENMNTEDSSRNESVASLESSLLVENLPLAQQNSTISPEITSLSEDNSSSSQQLPQYEVLTVDIPPDEPDLSLGNSDFTVSELSTPVNDVDNGISPDILQETNVESNSANQLSTPTAKDSTTLSASETQDSSSGSTSSPEHFDQQLQFHDENEITHNFVQHSFMDLESEPDIMTVLSLSNVATSDVIMPTQSAEIEETSPRRTVGTCNLRTLFQVPDSESAAEANNDIREGIQDDTTSREEVSDDVNVLENSDSGVVENRDNNDITQADIETSNDMGASGFSGGNLTANERANSSDELPSSSTSIVQNSCGKQVHDIAPDNEQFETEQVSLEEAGAIAEDELSESVILENPHSTPTVSSNVRSQSSFDELVSQRTTLPSPVPSITYVRYLRSKNLSIRLPSRTASPLPVVHVVPPNVPVSRTNSESDVPSASIEADPILSATRLDSPVQEASPVCTRSLARDIFDAPVSSREAINEGASTSQSGASLSDAAAGVQTSSVPSVPNSGPKRRSSNKRKNKSRARTSRHASATEPTDDAEFGGQSRRRISEDRPNRNNEDNTVEGTNDESTHRPASIYVQISDFASDEDVLDGPLPPRK